MKNMRKLFAILLAVMLIMSLAATVSATPEGTLTGGSITIKDAVSGHTYNAYQLMYLEVTMPLQKLIPTRQILPGQNG